MTRQQRINLATLTLYCHNLPKGYEHFDMEQFMSETAIKDDDSRGYCKGQKIMYGATCEITPRALRVHTCGTNACFAGHGPAAGIAFKKKENWGNYTSRVFGGDYYTWLFDAYWGVGNTGTVQHACRRAAWLLQNSIWAATNEEECLDETSEVFLQFKPDWKYIELIAKGAL